MEKEFYTLKEVSTKLAVSDITVRRLMDAGKLVYYKIGGQRRVSYIDLDNYLKQQRIVN